MNTGVFLCFTILGLAVLLARENKLRRGLQVLCSRLLSRLGDFQRTGQRHDQAQHANRQHSPRSRPSKLPATHSSTTPNANARRSHS